MQTSPSSESGQEQAATSGFVAQVEEAAHTRVVIEQAKGILVGIRCASPEQAFAELRHVSQNHNVKVNALAAALVHVAAGNDGLADAALVDIVDHEWGGILRNC